MLNRTGLLLFLIFISFQLSAQLDNRLWVKGYYLNFSDQKTEGYFSASGQKYEFVKFKKTENSEGVENLSPFEAKVISNDEDFYIQSQEVMIRGETEVFFIKKVIEGKIDLYRGYDKVGWRYYLMDNIENDSILLIPPNTIKPFIKTVFATCPNAWQDNYVYDLNSLLFTFQEANNCLGERAKVLKETGEILVKEKLPSVFSIGISPHVSYNFNVSSFNRGATLSTYDEVSSVGYGLNFLLNYNRFFQLETGIRFGATNMESGSSKGVEFNRPIYVISGVGTEVLIQEQIYNFPSSAQIEMSFYEVPIQGKVYVFKNKKVSPFLGIGLTFRKITAHSYERKFEEEYSAKNIFTANPYPSLENLSVEFLGYNHSPLSSNVNWNFGFDYKINKRSSIHIAYHMSEQNYDFDARFKIDVPMEFEVDFRETFNLKTTRRFIELGYSYYFLEKIIL